MQKTTEWSGGTTTELYIYPPDSEYSRRNFLFRISSAKIDIETSDFTILPETERLLMTLDNELVISHDGKNEKILKPFEKYCFDGGLTTKSRGKVTDFNLMLKNHASGDIEAIVLKQNEKATVQPTGSAFEAFYIYKGIVKITCCKSDYSLKENDFFILDSSNSSQIEILANENSSIIKVFVK